ncbi:MAG: hypothetical protein KY464_06020 [Gemmatimonadetes bacterium]|nr:hypothetical protein [Gemmatimonadota bacterium]
MESSRTHQCPDCGSDQMSWHVHRTGTRSQRYSQKELHWVCRECGYQRIEGMNAIEPPRTMPPPPAMGG